MWRYLIPGYKSHEIINKLWKEIERLNDLNYSLVAGRMPPPRDLSELKEDTEAEQERNRFNDEYEIVEHPHQIP